MSQISGVTNERTPPRHLGRTPPGKMKSIEITPSSSLAHVSSSGRKTRRFSHIASGIGPALSPSLLRTWLEGAAASVNLHANELTTLDINATDLEKTRCRPGQIVENCNNDVGILEGLVELDVSSNRLGQGSREGAENGSSPNDIDAGATSSLLSLTPNLQGINMSANDIDAEALVHLLSITPAVRCMAGLANLLRLNLSHNNLNRIPPDLHRCCPRLQDLNAVNNRIHSLPALLKSLHPLRNTLASLQLCTTSIEGEGNSVCSAGLYRERLICIMSNLNKLDGCTIVTHERDDARLTLDTVLLETHEEDESAPDFAQPPGDTDGRLKRGGERKMRGRDEKVGSTEACNISKQGRVVRDKRCHLDVQKNSRRSSAGRASVVPAPCAVGVISRKFDKALSRIRSDETIGYAQSRRRRRSDGAVQDENDLDYSAQGYDEDGPVTLGDGDRQQKGKDWAHGRQDGMAQNGEASKLTAPDASLRRLNKLESRVKLLSDLAGEQAEATQQLLLENRQRYPKNEPLQSAGDISKDGAETASQRHEARKSPYRAEISRVSDASTQANHSSAGGESQLDTASRAVQTRSDEYSDQLQLAVAASERRSKQIKGGSFIIFAKLCRSMVQYKEERRRNSLRLAFTRMALHTIIAQQAEGLKRQRSALKQKRHDEIAGAVNDAIMEERTRSDGLLDEYERKIDTLQCANEKLLNDIAEGNKRVESLISDREKMEQLHDKEMALLGHQVDARVKKLLDEKQEDEKKRKEIYEERAHKVLRHMEQEFEKRMRQAHTEREAVCIEMNSARRQIEEERKRQREVEERCKQLETERDNASDKAKEEALKLCDIELKRAEKQAQTRILQFKKAFEATASRAASDRAKCEKALLARRESMELVETQKSDLDSLRTKMRRMQKDADCASETIEEFEIATKDLSVKNKKLRAALNARDTQVSSLETEVVTLQADLKRSKGINNRTASDLDLLKRERDHAERQCLANAEKIATLEDKVESLQIDLKEAEEAAKEAVNSVPPYDIVKENERLRVQLDQRNAALSRCEEDLISVQAAFERKELQLTKCHEEAIEDLQRKYKRALHASNEKLNGEKRQRENENRQRILAEEDARALAQQLDAERNLRFKSEESVRSLTLALQNQRSRMQSAVEGLVNQLSPPTVPIEDQWRKK